MFKNALRVAVFNPHQKVRSGWWILLFIGLIVATQPLYRLITGQLRASNVPELIVELVSPLMILLVTYLCARLYKQRMKDVGLSGNWQWWRQALTGTALGGVWLLAVAAPLWLMGGVSFSINPNASLNILLVGLHGFILGALLEEVLHRGFIFQRLINGIGFVGAQILVAATFTFGHLNNPEMTGFTMLIASLDLAIASLIFGFAYYRTGSIALPLGLHLGWNWMQGGVLGFNVSGHEAPGLLQASLGDLPNWLSGGQFGLEGGVLSPAVSLIVLMLIWRWKGVAHENPSPLTQEEATENFAVDTATRSGA